MQHFTEEDWDIATRFLFLSLTLSVVQQDLSKLQHSSPFKIMEPYLHLLQRMETICSTKKRELHAIMQQKQLQVQVIPRQQDDSLTSYLFTCQDKQETRNYFNPALRKKVATLFEEILRHSTT